MTADEYKDVHFSLVRSDDGNASLTVELHNPAYVRFVASPNKLTISSEIREGVEYDSPLSLSGTMKESNEKLEKMFEIFLPELLDKASDHNLIKFFFFGEDTHPFILELIPEIVEEFKYSQVEVEMLKRQFKLFADEYRRFEEATPREAS